MQSFNNFIKEGRNDPSIFHAVFMAGSPGAGKSHVAELLTLSNLGSVSYTHLTLPTILLV